VFATLGASLAVGVTFAGPAAASAPANCLDTLYVTDTSTGNVRAVTTGGVAGATLYDATPGTATTPNQLGIGDDGAYAINTSSAGIHEYTFATDTITTTTKQTAANVNGIAGAINPKNGYYYYGGYTNSASPLVLWAYNPATNTSVGPVASITVPTPPASGGNGDIAFGSDGTLYFVAASANTSNLYRLDAQLPTTTPQQTFNATLLTSTSGLTAASNGIAFASDGYLYLGSSTTLQKVNPVTGLKVGSPVTFTGGITSTDLGTCAGPNTIEAHVTLPDGRLTPGDQFVTSVSGGSYSPPTPNPPTFPSGTTTGTDSGPQTDPNETAGPGIVLPGETYTTTVTGAPGTNISDYATLYVCTDADGNQTRTGEGTSVSITPTTGTGVTETCAFTVQNPVSLTKTVAPQTFDAVGDVLTYTFVAKNDDNGDLANFQLDDGMPGLGPVTCTPVAEGQVLPANASTTCTADYVITEADVQAGATKSNTATMTTEPRLGTTRTSSATSSVLAANNAAALVATDDSANTEYSTPVTLPASANDTAGTSPVVATSTVFTSAAATSGGTLLSTPEGDWSVLSDGRVRFIPAFGYSGTTPAVEYEVTDENGFTDTANLTVTVRSRPTAAPDTISTSQNVTVTFLPLTNDTPGDRADGTDGAFDTTTLIFPASGQPGTVTNSGRTLTVTSEGVYTINATNGSVTFNPDATFTGTANPVTYEVTDQSGGNRATSTITVRVRPVTPTATDDTANTTFNAAVTLPGLRNDTPGTDDNGTPADTSDDTTVALNAAATVFPTNGQPTSATVSNAGKTLTVTGQGAWEIQPDGSVTFTSANGYSGVTDTVVYRIEDINGNTDTATLAVRVRPGPDAVNDTTATTFDTTASVNVLTNDTPGVRADGTPGTFTDGRLIVTGNLPADSTVSPDGQTLTVAGEGVYTLDVSAGTLTFNPDATFAGVATPVTYEVTDALGNTDTATVTVTVRPGPNAVADTPEIVFDETVTVPVLNNDTPGQQANGTPGNWDLTTLELVLTGNLPTGSTLTPDGKTLTVPGEGVYTVAPNGEVTFDPDATFVGDTTPVTYTVTDFFNNTDTATVTVTVRPGPDAVNDTDTTPQNVNVTVTVLDNDTPGQQPDGTRGNWNAASVQLLSTGSLPTGSTVTPDGKTLTVPGEGVYTVAPNGEVTFDPAPLFVGTASPVTYTVTDSFGNSDTATVSITVIGISPDATDDTAVTRYGQPVVLDATTDDTPGSATAPLVLTATVFPNTGQPLNAVISDAGKTLTVPNEGVYTIRPDGTVRFVPATGFAGNATSVTYQIEDANGTTDTAMLGVTVQAGPQHVEDFGSTTQNVNVTVDPLSNDTAAVDVDGTARASFDPASLVLTLTPALPNGSVLSPDGKTLTVPGQGTYTVASDGKVSFDPVPTFTGTATPVAYEVTDSFANTSGSTITITVAGLTPVAVDDRAATPYGVAVDIDVLGNDVPATTTAALDPTTLRLIDPTTGQPVVTLTVAEQGVWTVVDGKVRFAPADGFSGTPTPVTYQVADVNGTTAKATITVTVGDPAPVQPGVASPVDGTTTEGEPVTINVVDGVTPTIGEDVDPDTLCLLPGTVTVNGDKVRVGKATKCVTEVDVPNVGTFMVNPDGTVTFTPVDGFVGVTSIDYQVEDTAGFVYSDTITVTVTGDKSEDPVDPVDPTVNDNDDSTNNDNVDGTNDDQGGLLPDTGGVSLMVLLLSGLALLGGFTLMVSARRRA
jgi:LPXTG-motif cell wall-anchored protein